MGKVAEKMIFLQGSWSKALQAFDFALSATMSLSLPVNWPTVFALQ